jgi:hypothetical protein
MLLSFFSQHEIIGGEQRHCWFSLEFVSVSATNTHTHTQTTTQPTGSRPPLPPHSSFDNAIMNDGDGTRRPDRDRGGDGGSRPDHHHHHHHRKKGRSRSRSRDRGLRHKQPPHHHQQHHHHKHKHKQPPPPSAPQGPSPLARLSEKARDLMRRDSRVGYPSHQPEAEKERCVVGCGDAVSSSSSS